MNQNISIILISGLINLPSFIQQVEGKRTEYDMMSALWRVK